uniref:Hemoglobin subunit beta-like n=1 Tax=Geotrypetes seraphini TaxID=260995 RepID=A0A6P8SIN9_GEOSA|nr:hemoglobin subunit beta-like [Geotrypetes seraphini]
MVHLTEEEAKCVHDFVSKICVADVGADILCRLLCVYPWCGRYFTSFGDLKCEDSICHNAQVKAHGARVLNSILDASKHLNDLTGYYAKLSKHHCESLHVDPANFYLMKKVMLVSLAIHCKSFDAHTQHCMTKFLHAVADSLGKQYC